MTQQTSPMETARSQIETSGLRKTTVANALALLARAHPHNGHVTLTWESLCDLFGLTHRRSATRHLTYLSQAGVIHYSTNAQVFVTFYAWTPLRVGAQELRVGAQELRVGAQELRVGAQAAETDAYPPARGRAEIARGRAEIARGRAESNGHNKEYMFVCLFVDPSIPLSEILNKQTNNQQAAYALLTDPDVALAELTAADIAGGVDHPDGYTLDFIQRQVFAWLRDMETGRVTSAGALITRIRRGFQARSISDDDRERAIWKRHFPDQPAGSRYTDNEFADLIIR